VTLCRTVLGNFRSTHRHDLTPRSGLSLWRCWGTGVPQAHIYVEGNHPPMVHFTLYIPRHDS